MSLRALAWSTCVCSITLSVLFLSQQFYRATSIITSKNDRFNANTAEAVRRESGSGRQVGLGPCGGHSFTPPCCSISLPGRKVGYIGCGCDLAKTTSIDDCGIDISPKQNPRTNYRV